MAVDYRFVDDIMGVPPPNTVSDTTQQFPLGLIALAEDRQANSLGIGELMYVKFTGSVTAGDFVIYDTYLKTAVQTPAAAASAKAFPVGITLATQVNGNYGWILIRGSHDAANIANGVTLNQQLSGSGTAGRATTATANYAFYNGRCSVVPSGNIGGASIDRPFVPGV